MQQPHIFVQEGVWDVDSRGFAEALTPKTPTELIVSLQVGLTHGVHGKVAAE